MAKVQIYKKNQGKYTRSLTFVGVMILAVAGAYNLAQLFGSYDATNTAYIQILIPAAVVVAMGFLMFWVVNRPKTADFMIATEGEMKKVSWSSKKEIIGSTKVVIVTTFLLAAILFAVDFVFTLFFQAVLGG
ncbi:MAG: preprotein translocase subunit SecE [Phycisphaerae bacterium]